MTDAFIQALADAAEENLIDLEDLRAKCLAKVANGGGELAFTITAGLNAKSAAQECKMDAATLLGAVNQAIRIARGTFVGVTYCDFSEL